MKRITAALIGAVLCVSLLAGCGATANAPDGRTGITGEICMFGVCVKPQLAAQAPQELYNAIPGGSLQPVVSAPVTAVAGAVAPAGVYTATYAAPEALPPPISFNSPVAVSRPAAVAYAPRMAPPPAYAGPPPQLTK